MATGSEPRARVFRHLKRNLDQATLQTASVSATDGDNVGPDTIGEIAAGYAQLYSYYEPGLQGGRYEINIDHKLRHPDFPVTPPPNTTQATWDQLTSAQTANPKSNQQFNVNVPRFNLPPGIIHQTYPPQGMADHNNVLPHMVFEDAHFPWENEGSPKQDLLDEKNDHIPGHPESRSRNKVPWIALWTFGEDEIKLSATELQGVSKGGLFPDVVQIPSQSSPLPAGREQDKATFAVKLTMGEYLAMGGWPANDPIQTAPKNPQITIPTFDNDKVEPIDRDEQVNVVFVQRDLFERHVCNYNVDGTDSSPQPSGTPDLSRYQYLSHVRNVNQVAMAGLDLPDKGLYSVVHAHRTGSLNITSAKPVIVHLVSIMDIENNVKLPLDRTSNASKWVALISLHAWTYLCLPPDSVNFVDTMRSIGRTIKDGGECWLRAPDNTIRKAAGLQAPTSTAASEDIAKVLDGVPSAQRNTTKYRLASRLFDGYSLQRYLLQTGEQTVAFYRGPLSPTYVPPLQTRNSGGWWPLQSNFSSDYQVLDPKLGIMDITYSAAWQLGRTLGIADQAFTAALIRLRGAIITKASLEAKKIVVGAKLVKSKAEAMSTMMSSMDALAKLSAGQAGQNALPTENRVNKLVNPAPEIVLQKPTAKEDRLSKPVDAFTTPEKQRIILQQKVVAAATGIASAMTDSTTNNDDTEVFIPFNEINVPASPDWQIVQSWILDKLSLHNIPAHYMLSDPTHLPQDSIRFFYIDSNWFDAFIDGALSIGNHLDQEDDVARQAFKRQLNRYLATPLGEGNLNYLPQVPTFGFFLRSGVVKAFPNLEVHAPWRVAEEMGGNRMETVRLDCLEKDTLFCLFDRTPGQKHWNNDQGDGSQRTDITICQPPHQQCFRLGADATTEYVEMQYRAVYTKEPTDLAADQKVYDSLCLVKWRDDVGPMLQKNETEVAATFVNQKKIFDHKTNTLVFPAFAQSCVDVLKSQMERPNNSGGKTKYFEDQTGTSAVTAVILNSFVSVMNIKLPEAPNKAATDATTTPPDTTVTPRQIRVPQDADGDKATWKIVPADDPPIDTRPKPRPAPDPSKTIAPPPLPSPPSKRPTSRPSDWSDSNFTFPPSERTSLPPKTLPLRSTIPSQWLIDAFVLGTTTNPPPNTTNPVPFYPPTHPRHGLPLDLIIRIIPSRSGQDTLHNLQIFYLQLTFELGALPTTLMESYDGPGGSMLNNQKWNVHTSFSKPAHVSFTLIPRSTTRLSAMRKNEDLTFAVWGVVPNGVEGKVQGIVKESYRCADKTLLDGQVQTLTASANCDLQKKKMG